MVKVEVERKLLQMKSTNAVSERISRLWPSIAVRYLRSLRVVNCLVMRKARSLVQLGKRLEASNSRMEAPSFLMRLQTSDTKSRFHCCALCRKERCGELVEPGT